MIITHWQLTLEQLLALIAAGGLEVWVVSMVGRRLWRRWL